MGGWWRGAVVQFNRAAIAIGGQATGATAVAFRTEDGRPKRPQSPPVAWPPIAIAALYSPNHYPSATPTVLPYCWHNT
jgi:hypothetical protein